MILIEVQLLVRRVMSICGSVTVFSIYISFISQSLPVLMMTMTLCVVDKSDYAIFHTLSLI